MRIDHSFDLNSSLTHFNHLRSAFAYPSVPSHWLRQSLVTHNPTTQAAISPTNISLIVVLYGNSVCCQTMDLFKSKHKQKPARIDSISASAEDCAGTLALGREPEWVALTLAFLRFYCAGVEDAPAQVQELE